MGQVAHDNLCPTPTCSLSFLSNGCPAEQASLVFTCCHDWSATGYLAEYLSNPQDSSPQPTVKAPKKCIHELQICNLKLHLIVDKSKDSMAGTPQSTVPVSVSETQTLAQGPEVGCVTNCYQRRSRTKNSV